MFDERRAARVGAVVMALVGTLAAAVLLIDCSRLRSSIDLTIDYRHIGQLTEGADVQIAGRVVGTVTAVQLVTAVQARDPAHLLHPGGGVAVHVRLERRYAGWASPGSDFFITTKGVIGEPYVEIGPPRADGAQRALRDGDEVRGADPARMEQVLVKSFENMTAFRRLLDDIAPSASELRQAIARLEETLADLEPEPAAYATLGKNLGELDRAVGELTGGWRAAGIGPNELRGLAGAAGALAEHARRELAATTTALDHLSADLARVRGSIPPDLVPRLEHAIASARAQLARVEQIVATGQYMVARVQRGHGTVGALLNDPEFIDDAKQLGKILKREPWRVLGHPRKEALEKQ